MILVIEMDKLLSFTEEQRNCLTTLTAKDQIYLIAKDEDTLPIALVPVINKINAKMEIRNLSDANSSFGKGFLYGTLSSPATKDKVIFFSSEEAPQNLSPNCLWNEGFADVKPKKKRTPSAKKADGPSEAAKADDKQDGFQLTLTDIIPEKKTRAKKSDGDAKDLFSHPSVKAALTLIGDGKDAFRKCLSDSSDAIVGYKYMLQLHFKDNGLSIWEKTYEKYDALKKLAKMNS